MTKPSFVYVTYIVTTPQKVWDAITDAELSAKPTGPGPTSRTGRWVRPGAARSSTSPPDLIGKVLEARPARGACVLTWASGAECQPGQSRKRTSKVAFDIEAGGRRRCG